MDINELLKLMQEISYNAARAYMEHDTESYARLCHIIAIIQEEFYDRLKSGNCK